MKPFTHNNPCGEGTFSQVSSVHVVSDFFPQATMLRAEFDQQIAGSPEAGGITPLNYVYRADAHQFLSASASRIFTATILGSFIDTLSRWAENELGTSHVSTPQVRVYINGCSRQLLTDDVAAVWHFIFSLTQLNSQTKPRDSGSLATYSPTTEDFGRLLITKFRFNQLIVHLVSHSYRIEAHRATMNPLEGVILLDGYLW
jgi:hypothetical protein